MATTITAQSLTITISEIINLNGQPIDSENQLVIPSITQIDKRIMSIPNASEVTMLTFGSSVAAGQVIAVNVKYLRITNKDAVNFVRIRVKKNGADTFDIKIDAGKSFMLGNPSESVSATAGTFSAFVIADSINCQADTASVDCEIFVASI